MNKTRIAVCGAAGKMGASIIRLANAASDLEIIGGVEFMGSPAIGSAAGSGRIVSDIAEIISSCDVVIDFTAPGPTLEHLAVAQQNRIPVVIGTTGIDADGVKAIRKASESIPLVYASNMSVGVNLLFRLAREVAKIIPGYDVEIVEMHHNQKKDAPSGTAVTLSQVIAESLKRDIEHAGVYGRKGITGPRKKEEIGIHAVRGGDIVGDHTVYFVGPGERIELTHRMHSRDTLASGALTAARWLVGKNPGLYDMQDVLGLRQK